MTFEPKEENVVNNSIQHLHPPFPPPNINPSRPLRLYNGNSSLNHAIHPRPSRIL